MVLLIRAENEFSINNMEDRYGLYKNQKTAEQNGSTLGLNFCKSKNVTTPFPGGDEALFMRLPARVDKTLRYSVAGVQRVS